MLGVEAPGTELQQSKWNVWMQVTLLAQADPGTLQEGG